MAKKDFHGYLSEFMRHYPANPSQAYWRTIEALLLQEETYPAPLLDLGCGDGSFASVLFGGLGIRPDSACDLHPAKTAAAAARNIYPEVLTADILALPYKDASFAAVFSNCVIEHIPDDVAALREAARVLKPGGRFIFTVPSDSFVPALPRYRGYMARGLEAEAKAYAGRMDKRLEHCRYRSAARWRELLDESGFAGSRVTPYMSAAEEAAWARFLSVEDFVSALPRHAGLVLRPLLRRVAASLLGPAPGGVGGGLLITAVKHV
ncbi:MAG: methyltransferase domain-containing protein [Elusimicrobia bacterium]|nr:methyltransferase domain-containing protein [Elusimicrobiota bacterium]